jgi:Raf kinase inhibitor-like YbhB/YbcL family protein
MKMMKRIKVVFGLFLITILVCACSENKPSAAELQPPSEELMQKKSDFFNLKSSAFTNMAIIPEIYTCDGMDISPPLNWDIPPSSSQSLVLIMDDPDAPVGTWDHWILFNLPTEMTDLPEDITQLPPGAKYGSNSWRKNKYGGPCPPGTASHRYYFKIYALDIKLDIVEGSKKSDIEKAMNGHILAYSELIGIYRP